MGNSLDSPALENNRKTKIPHIDYYFTVQKPRNTRGRRSRHCPAEQGYTKTTK